MIFIITPSHGWLVEWCMAWGHSPHYYSRHPQRLQRNGWELVIYPQMDSNSRQVYPGNLTIFKSSLWSKSAVLNLLGKSSNQTAIASSGFQWLPVASSGFQWLPVASSGFQWLPVRSRSQVAQHFGLRASTPECNQGPGCHSWFKPLKNAQFAGVPPSMMRPWEIDREKSAIFNQQRFGIQRICVWWFQWF